jgi:flagellar M-ring protein FliF
LLNRFRDWWDGQAATNRVIVIASAVGSVIALIGFIVWANTPEYGPLYTGLSASDANTITDKLKEWNVPFHLLAGGTAIEVPQAQHDEVMLKLAGQNIQPTNAEASWGADKDTTQGGTMVATQAVEDENIRKARENEVSRIISHMQPISTARVMYTPGDSSPYSIDVDKHEASASVIVNTRQGQNLSDENVQAIVRLVQMAFKGLSDQKITVSDTRAQMLWDGTQSGRYGENMLSKQQRDEERRQTASLQAALNQVWPNKTVVHVHVEKSRDHRTTHKTTAEDGAVASVSKETEELKGLSGDVSRVAAGASANGVGAPGATGTAPIGLPTYPAGGAESSGSYNHEIKTETRTPSVVETTTQEDPGKIEKFTVSALVDKAVPTDDIPKIKTMLATAIGVVPNDPTQSRQVVVEQVAFEVPKPEKDTSQADNMTRILSLVVPLALMLVCFVLLARALKSPMRLVPGRQLALQGAGSAPGGGAITFDSNGVPLAIAGGAGDEDTIVNGVLTKAKSPVIGVPVGDIGPKTYDVIEEAFDSNLESILHMARSKPETVSALLKGWLSDES